MKIINGITTAANQQFRVTIGGTAYLLKLVWSDMSHSWFCSLYTANGDPISTGRRLSTNMPIFTHLLTGLSASIAPASLVSPAVSLGRYAWGKTHSLVISDATE